MAKSVVLTLSPTRSIKFIVEANKDKTFKQFAEHEKHHGLTKEQYREVYDLIQIEAGNKVEKEAPAPDAGPDDTAAG
jgi:predicted transcriptional regulator